MIGVVANAFAAGFNFAAAITTVSLLRSGHTVLVVMQIGCLVLNVGCVAFGLYKLSQRD